MSLNNLKLGVDVVSAYIVEPEDGEESASPYVELFFDGQRYRTTVKDNNLSPVWDESFYLSISDPSVLQHLNLEAFVYSTIRGGNTRSLLGKVSICGTSFVPHSDAVVLQYPLKKGRIFSRVKGEIRLKVYITDDPSINSTPSARDLPRVEYSHDLVQRMNFLYVNIVKARDLPIEDITDSPVVGYAESPDLFVEVRVGKYKGVTKHINDNLDPEWNAVFAFSKDGMQDSVLDVEVKNGDPFQDDSLGVVRFDLNEVPMRVPPESPLVPQWYRLEDNMGEKIDGELMLAVWTGTQADAAFYDAWHFDESIPIIDLSCATCTKFRQKVYHAPTLCYARVTVIKAQELEPTDRTRFPEVYVKARMGDQVESTRILQTRTLSPCWNEDLFFVVADTFEGHVVLTVENHVSSEKDEILGYVTIALGSFNRRVDDRAIPPRWYNLEKPITTDQLKKPTKKKNRKTDQLKKEKCSSRLLLRLSVDGGYHVLDESIHYSSDLRPAVDELCNTSIGVLELGICEAELLHPMKTRDGKETSDIYCVAKYGKEWVRTRTIIDSISPKYNEQYTWEVYDRATVLTVGVFDNRQFGAKGSNGNDLTVGKVEIRISTLEPGRVYSHFYPLLDLQPTGFKRNGQLHLAIRFSCTSFVNIICQYHRPLLPKMHYIQPIPQQETMRNKAVNIVAMRLGRAEPALTKEVVAYMYEGRSFWSLRRSKANFFRLMDVLSRFNQMWLWFGGVCSWRNPVTTVVVHIVFLILVCFPWLILPIFFLSTFLVVVRNYRYRPRHPYNKDARVSLADTCYPDELDEEFDTFPTSQSWRLLLQMRYDRLRYVARRLQVIAGDLATHGERILAVVTWRDPFATAIFGIFCIVAAVLVYVTPLKVLVALSGLYTMRHPWFRSPLPALLRVFLSRLPDRTETML